MNVVLKVYRDGEVYIFKQWTDITINLGLNTVASTFSLTGWMDDSNRFIFKPFGYSECVVYLEDDEGNYDIKEPLITGFLVNPGLNTQKTPQLTTITGFSRPGILEYSYMPVGETLTQVKATKRSRKKKAAFQYKNTSIKTISEIICELFNLELYIHPGARSKANELIKEFNIKPNQPLKAFLSELCIDKGITVAHDNKGRLYLYRILNITPAISRITHNDYHMSMTCSPNGQGMHTECNVILDGDIDNEDKLGEKAEIEKPLIATALSPFLNTTVRSIGSSKNATESLFIPKNVTVSQATSKRELQEKADLEICKEARNFPVKIRKEGWDFNGRIVRAGFYLEIQSPDLFITQIQKMVVENMTFTKKAKNPEMLDLTCVLPCVYTGKLPTKGIFNV